MKREIKERYDFAEVVDIIRDLRAEGGCPWDRAQTFESLESCLTNETQEVFAAVGAKDWQNLCEEWGDILLQVLLNAQIAEEAGYFTIDDVITSLGRKMIRRHPHVFGDEEIASEEEALVRWEEIKREERAKKGGKP